MDINGECVQPCSILKQPQTHEKPPSWIGNGTQTPTLASEPKIRVWEKPLQNAIKQKAVRKEFKD